MNNDDLRWRAVEIGDVRAAGTFVHGRDSDGIYHLPICCRRPSRDEIGFFDTPVAARRLKHGRKCEFRNLVGG